MEYVLVAFKVRAHTLKFSNFLTQSGIFNQVVNTPKEAGVGCGLSVKISPKNFSVVNRAVKMSGLKSFAGFFAVKRVGGKIQIKTI